MQNTSRGLSFDDARERGAVPSRQVSSVVRARMTVAGLLTLAAVGIGIVVGLAFGQIGLALYVLALPVPLCLLWLAADVVRADEREADR